MMRKMMVIATNFGALTAYQAHNRCSIFTMLLNVNIFLQYNHNFTDEENEI